MSTEPLRPRISPLLPLLLAGLAGVACEQEPAPALMVGPLTFSERELLGLSPSRRKVLANVAALALAHQDDSASALLTPLTDQVAKRDLAERLYAELTVEGNRVSRAELRERYLVDPELELEVRHIIYLAGRQLPAETRAEAEAQARAALERARAGEPFPELAAQLSEEPGAAPREGLLQPGREGAWVDEFWDAARALEVGEVSDVVETQYGYHVLKLEAKRIVPFAEARDRAVTNIAEDLVSDSADAWVTRLASEISPTDTPHGEGGVLARWGSDVYTEADHAPFLATRALLGAEGTESLGEGRSQLLEGARVHFMALEAERRGLGAPSPPEQAREVQELRLDLQRWIEVLGLDVGAGGAEALKASALEGLGRTGQGAEIARTEIEWLASLLQTSFPVRDLTEGA